MGLLPLRSRLILLGVILPLELALVLFSSLFPATPITPTSFYGNSFSGEKVFLFFTMIPLGFMFVAALNKRRNVLISRFKNYWDFFVTVLLGVSFFFVAPIRTIHAPADNDWTSPSTADLLNFNFPGTEFESLAYNYCLYIIPFVIGLHFRLKELLPNHDKILMAVTWKKVRETYNWKDYLMMGTLGLVSLALITFHVALLFMANLLVPYVAFFFTCIFLFFSVYACLRKTHFMRWRYYMLTGFLVLFTPFQNGITAFTQALLIGITVEGIATKGLSPILLRRPTAYRPTPQAATPVLEVVALAMPAEVVQPRSDQEAVAGEQGHPFAEDLNEYSTGDDTTLLRDHERDHERDHKRVELATLSLF